MNPLLAQFLTEARDFLQGIGEKLMLLEDAPDDKDLMNELFRLVHTLKGNSGLFDFPEMTRVLHAGEDLMDAVRNGRVAYSRELADRLLDAMDFVNMLCDGIEGKGGLSASETADSARLAESLRQLIPRGAGDPSVPESPSLAPSLPGGELDAWPLASIPEAARMEAFRCAPGASLFLVHYAPAESCFYQGDDPLFLARQTPGLVWGGVVPPRAWPALESLDAYRCVLGFRVLAATSLEELQEHYRYVPDQIHIRPLSALVLAVPVGDPNGGPVYEDFVAEALAMLAEGRTADLGRAARTMLELSNPELWLSSALRWLLLLLEQEPENAAAHRRLIASLQRLEPPDWNGVLPHRTAPATPPPGPPAYLRESPESDRLPLGYLEYTRGIFAIQRAILGIADDAPWSQGRIQAAAGTISACLLAMGHPEGLEGLDEALAEAVEAASGAPVIAWLDELLGVPDEVLEIKPVEAPAQEKMDLPAAGAGASPAEGEVKFGRRAEDTVSGSKSLKVDQAKIDRLMNLIGEMVVSKNALPYLAGRAETVFGVRDLAREIKAQYAVINRIAEEMQDAIMQVRMMPVSFVFQRFPRLVRDISRKLGKDVNLVLVGEETEADKNIIEALGDPLVHIVRNSLDHGFELPDLRRAAGKPPTGTLTIRATQESDRVQIEIQDDGKGIDPAAIKRKAFERGVIDEAALERLTDQEAVNLIFAPGLSTAEVVSDLSGRGVGMDVVRTAVERVNGSIQLESELGKGTRLVLSLPLSMAVTNVIIVESDGQVFGVPMESVIETVRVPRSRIRTIKRSPATVLRGRIVALKSLNASLGITRPPRANGDDELAILVVRVGDEPVGLMVDNFHETVDVILKPMLGILGGLSAYAGSALMGDGSVLMVLNVKEVL